MTVEPGGRVVERHYRDESAGGWGLGTFAAGTPRTRVPVPCPEAVLTLDEIYENTGLA